jgi:hypothetical protein
VRVRWGRKLVGGVALGCAVAGSTAVPAAGTPRPVGVPLAVAASPAQFPDDGLGTTGLTTYVVDPANRVIHVSVDLTATNLVPGGRTTYTYFDAVAVFTLAEAVNVVAVDASGRNLGVGVEPIDGTETYAFIRVDLANQLTYQETHTIRVTYDLPDQGPRALGITRVNPAYAAVVPIPVGDPGFATVRVNVPKSLSVEVLIDALGAALAHHAEAIGAADRALADELGDDQPHRDARDAARAEVRGAFLTRSFHFDLLKRIEFSRDHLPPPRLPPRRPRRGDAGHA